MLKPSNYRILIVDDEEGIRYTLGLLLKKEGYRVDDAADFNTALERLQSERYDLALMDIMLSGESGIGLLKYVKSSYPEVQVVMCTGFPKVESAAEAVRLGAFDYITKPIRHETLLLVTRHALNAKVINDERELYRANLDAIFHSISDSIIMVDRDGRLSQFNATAEHVCGYESDMIGGDAALLDMGCGGGCRKALLETLQSKTPRVLNRIECSKSQGISRIVSINMNPIKEVDGSIRGAVAVIRDETQLANMERALKKRGNFHGLIGTSEPIQKVFSLIEALSDVPTTVLINGESGTGKELVAAALHFNGVRTNKPFVKVNCSALSESLLESELFGHVRGAFTGAVSDKVGRFQKAHGGTLFLDEIGDISPAVQMRLLRVLQESEFERVGESTPTRVDVRIIAATNQDLAEKVRQGSFRQDLFYRLNVIRIVLPSLKERLDDLALLAAHFVAKFNDKFFRNIKDVSVDVMEIFRSHDWPGNVRELEHAIEHATVLCKTDVITVQDLPLDLLTAVKPVLKNDTRGDTRQQSVKSALTLEEALAMADGNKTRAASLLGISRRTIYRHLEE